METLARLLTPFILLIFIVYPIISTLIYEWFVTTHKEIEYNPKFDLALPQKEGIIFKDSPPVMLSCSQFLKLLLEVNLKKIMQVFGN